MTWIEPGDLRRMQQQALRRSEQIAERLRAVEAHRRALWVRIDQLRTEWGPEALAGSAEAATTAETAGAPAERADVLLAAR